jgi:hypothetical protein
MENWKKQQFPKYDQIELQQETEVKRTLALQQQRKQVRQATSASAAGKRSQVVHRPGKAKSAFGAARLASR